MRWGKEDNTKLADETETIIGIRNQMDYPFVHKTLPTGIRLLVIQIPESALLRLELVFRLGMNNEGESQIEHAHLLEHMFAKLTSKKYPDGTKNMKRLADLGVEHNASTSDYLTRYYLTMQKEHFKEVMDYVTNAYYHFRPDPNLFEKERSAATEEILRMRDVREMKLIEKVDKILYRGHPKTHTLRQSVQSLKRIKSEELVDFWKKFYTSGAAMVVVAGDLEFRPMIRSLRRLYQHKLRTTKSNVVKYPLEDNFKGPVVERIRDDELHTHLVHFTYRLDFTMFDEVDFATAVLISGILTDGLESRLNQRLRYDHQYVYGISSNVQADEEMGALGTFVITTKTSKSPGKVETIILNTVEDLRTERVPDAELQKVKNAASVDILMSNLHRNFEKYVEHYMAYLLWDRPVVTRTECHKIFMDVTPDDVLRVSERMFDRRNLVYGLMQATRPRTE